MEPVETPQEQPKEPFEGVVIAEEPKKDWLKIVLFSLLGLFILSGAIYIGYWFAIKSWVPPSAPGGPTPEATPSARGGLTVEDQTKDWKVYRNTSAGYEIKYPAGTKVEEVGDPEKYMCVHLTVGHVYLRIKTPEAAYGGCVFTGGDTPTRQRPLEESFELLGEDHLDKGMDFIFVREDGTELHRELVRFDDVGGVSDFYIELYGEYVRDSTYSSYLDDKEAIRLMLQTFKFTEDATSDWKTYRSEEYGFEIKYPPHLTVRENETPLGITSVDFVREGDQESFEFRIEKNFLGGWIAKEYKEERIVVGGVKGTISLWLHCDSEIAEEWEECSRQLSIDNYDSATLHGFFERGSDEWYIFYKSWKKGEKDNDEEIQKLSQILSTFKFLD